MSLGGEENRDPTVDAALEVLKRPRIQTPLPALRGSGVAAAGLTPYEDYLRTWGNIAPEVTTASAVAPAPPEGSPGSMDAGGDNGFSSLSQAEQAAYYADNPTEGAIGRGALSYFSNTPLGMVQNYFDPAIQTMTDATMAGMNTQGWQTLGRNNDGIFGTTLGGTLSVPALSPENYGSHGELGAVYGPTVAESTTPSVPSWGQSQSAAAGVTDAPYGGYVTDGSGNVVTDGGGNPVAYGEGHANAAAADAASQAAAEAAYAEAAAANAAADSSASSGNVSIGGQAAASGSGHGPDGATAPDAVDAPSGDGGGGGKIICTAMNQAYGFGSFRNAIWIAYADKHLSKAHEVGYHALFLPLVDYAFKRGDGKLNLAVRKVLEWGTRHRSTDLRAEMRGTKRDTTGRIIRFIFEPLCYAAGKLKGY